MGRFNKTSAAVLGGAIATVVFAFIPEMSPVVIGALDTLVVAGLVWLVPNANS